MNTILYEETIGIIYSTKIFNVLNACNLHKLQDINEDFHVFAKNGIKEQELLLGRPYNILMLVYYRGCAIFLTAYLLKQKILVFAQVFLNYNKIVIICICVYMPNYIIINSNIIM